MKAFAASQALGWPFIGALAAAIHPNAWLVWICMITAWAGLFVWASLRIAELHHPVPFDWWVLAPNGPEGCDKLQHTRQPVCGNCRAMRRAEFVFSHPGEPIPNALLHPTFPGE